MRVAGTLLSTVSVREADLDSDLFSLCVDCY